MPHHVLLCLTFWDAKGRHDGLNQTQNIERTAAHISKEKHDPNAAAKLWTQSSADHVWGSKLRDFCLQIYRCKLRQDTISHLNKRQDLHPEMCHWWIQHGGK